MKPWNRGILAAAALVALAAFGQAKEIRIKCAVCDGTGAVVLHPPERLVRLAGNGAIGTARRFDRKIKCPLCAGKGRRVVLPVDEAPPEEGVAPCRKCGWNGFVVCKKCAGEGIAPCKARGCEGGWVLSKRQKGANGIMVPASLDPCPVCNGTAYVPCKACRGRRAEICRKCHGLGRDTRKDPPERKNESD